MGDCASSTSDSVALRKSGISQINLYQTKVSEEDYDFLRLPGQDIRHEKRHSKSSKRQNARVPPKQANKQNQSNLNEKIDPIVNEANKQSLSLKENLPISLEEGEDQLLNAYNAKSKIIKLSKKVKNIQSKTQENKVAVTSKRDEVMEGTLKNQQICSVIALQHEDIDMQFALPRCRAGPLIVPLVDYDKYER